MYLVNPGLIAISLLIAIKRGQGLDYQKMRDVMCTGLLDLNLGKVNGFAGQVHLAYLPDEFPWWA